MASTSADRPWVLGVAAAAGLLVVAVTVRHFSKSGSEGPSVAPKKRLDSVAALANVEAKGWSARSNGEERSRPGSATGTGSGGVGRGLTSTGGEAAAARGGGSAAVLQNRVGGAGGGGVGLGSGRSHAGGESIGIQAPPPEVTGALKDAQARMSAAQREGQVGRAVSGTPGVPGAQPNADDSEPIVSLPLKDTTDADKGNATPVDQGVTFDSGGAHFALDSQMVIPDVTINNDAGSVSLCLQPQWGGGDPSDASLFQLRTPNVWGNRLQLFKNGRYLRFILADETGTAESDPGIPIDNWQPNQPHLITSTWGRGPNGEGIASLFVDGQLASQKYFDGQLDIPPGTPMYLGSDLSGGAPGAQGSISNFQVYGRALPAEEIANLGCQ